MKEFVYKLEKETEARVRMVEMKEADLLKKSLEASNILGEAFDCLKKFIVPYDFQDAAEEIHFFKNVKPRLCAYLIYYHTIYNIELNRPLGSVEIQRRYLDKELEDIQDFNNKRLDFYRYWRSGSSSLDDIYFRRGKTDMVLYMESFYFEHDPKFSTNYDFKVARILANDMLHIFIRSELDALEESRYKNNDSGSQLNININAKKTEIIELMYALDTINFFGEKSLNRLTVLVENTFNIDLGNISRTFAEMKSRNIPTPFLDRAREFLLKRMGRKNSAN